MDTQNASGYWLRQFEEICERRGVAVEERELIWHAMAHMCFYQMHDKHGPFYEALQPLFEGRGEDIKTDPSLSG
jgi:hypothetical protein